MVDVLAFAAAVGARRKLWNPVTKVERERIRLDVFERQNYVPLINLLAVTRDGNVRVLADDDEMEERRADIFEGYANGGLDFLKEELRGSSDYLESIVLMFDRERRVEPDSKSGFDLRDIIEAG